MCFTQQPAGSGKFVVDTSFVTEARGRDISRSDCLAPEGETLYYKCTKNLKIPDDVLAGKIPDLQDLKDAKGHTHAPQPPFRQITDAHSMSLLARTSIRLTATRPLHRPLGKP